MKYTFFSEQEVVSSENVDKAESPLPKGWGKIIYRSLVKDLGPMGGAPYTLDRGNGPGPSLDLPLHVFKYILCSGFSIYAADECHKE